MLAALGNWPGAVWLQENGTAYLFVNAAHILGIGLLVGAILPLDLRLMGLFRSVPLAIIAPFLSRAALVGLCLTLPTGLWLFTVRPVDYVANDAFLWKLGLLALALGNVGLQHAGTGFQKALAGKELNLRVRILALISALLWLGVLLAGRWIGFR